jgi:hypothetical protein
MSSNSKPTPTCKKCGKPSTSVFPGYCVECALAIVMRKHDELNGLEVPNMDAGHNDLGNMERLVLRFGDKFRFTRATGWLYWTGTHWAGDETGRINASMRHPMKPPNAS